MKRFLCAAVTVCIAGVALVAWRNSAQAQATASTPASTAASAPDTSKIPPTEAGSLERLNKSPRHGEWVQVTVPGMEKPMRSYIVYPERADKAPVVMVVMEIFGMSDWVRATTDQLAADGFIAIAPDFLSGKGAGGADVGPDQARGMVSTLQGPEVINKLNATRAYASKLPAASGKVAVVGFCWGGTQAFSYAVAQPDLDAAVAFYGTPPTTSVDGKMVPDEAQLAKIKAPIAGFFGGSDARVTTLVAPTQDIMKKLNKTYEPHIFTGAGHGFMRQQDGPAASPGANLKAAQEAWPAAVKFIKDHTQ